MRKKPAVNIFNTKTKKPIRRPVQPGQRPTAPPQPNGPPLHSYQAVLNGPSKNNAPPPKALTAQSNGEPEPGTYDDFPIVVSKTELLQGLRHHAMKLQTRVEEGKVKTVNPYDESQFVRPLRLHRRYPRDKKEVAEMSDVASGVDDKERETMNARRAERQAEREQNQKLIAPTGGDTSKQPVKRKQQKKVEEGRDDSNPVRQKRSKLRYEEARPWHLEDFEGKNIYVGSYEEALSERSIMLEIKNDGAFHMVPIEKWYRFQQTNKVTKVMDSDEVEKALLKKVAPSRWAMGTQTEAEAAQKKKEMQRRAARARAAREEGEFQADRDLLDLDFKDEFQDDDEGFLQLGENSADEAELQQKLFLEMRDAGLGGTGVKDDDKNVEEEFRKEQLAKLAKRKQEKKLRKQLRKREFQGQYDSDSDSNDPYADSSDSLDSDDEQEEERKKAEELKKSQLNGDKSGASSRGTNTPSGRTEKHDQPRLGNSAKRPGSPDLSDLSGNESSRKKFKSLNGRPVSVAPGGARSLSRKLLILACSWLVLTFLTADAARLKPRAGGSGSGSDTDTSRRGRPSAKIKIKTSPPGSPSRQTPNGSRAGSPTASGSRTPVGKEFPTLEEVKAAIPAEGIAMNALVQLFKSKVPSSRSAEFIQLVKAAGQLSKDPDKKGRIVPKS